MDLKGNIEMQLCILYLIFHNKIQLDSDRKYKSLRKKYSSIVYTVSQMKRNSVNRVRYLTL